MSTLSKLSHLVSVVLLFGVMDLPASTIGVSPSPTPAGTAAPLHRGGTGRDVLPSEQNASTSVTVSPTSAVVQLNRKQHFYAHVTGTSNTAVIWAVVGPGCTQESCGTISDIGVYHAPQSFPKTAHIGVKVTSVADPSASATASVSLTSTPQLTISPLAPTVTAGTQQQFTYALAADLQGGVTWSVAGSDCAGKACGTISSRGLYLAPSTPPSKGTVVVTVASVEDPSVVALATVKVIAKPVIAVIVSPSSIQLQTGARQQFEAQVSGSSNTNVTWSVSGSGCRGSSCGAVTSAGLYTAPSSVPAPSTVYVKATSEADSTKSATSTVTIVAKPVVSVSISPSSVQLQTGVYQQFSATVSGSSNRSVTWSVSGSGCGGSSCGAVTSAGLYTAPSSVPTPSAVYVRATSVADSSKSATSTITLVAKPSISISPSAARVPVAGTQQFSVSTTGPVGTITWQLSGADCQGSTCGTVSSSGVYKAPASLPGNPQVIVTATNGTLSSSATVTLYAPVSISITIAPTAVNLGIGQSQQFQATVSGSSDTQVNWQLGGCSGGNCGTLSSSGFYTAPASVSQAISLTVTAVSQADSSKTASAAVTVVPSNYSNLFGQYVFFFKGFNHAGIYEAAGIFTADGKGDIVSGTEDVNQVGGPSSGLALAGTYQLGPDNRGLLTLKNQLGTQTLAFALNGDGTIAPFTSFDSSGTIGSGTIEKQDASAIGVSTLYGGYVLSLTGQNSRAQRIGVLGLIFPDGFGDIAGNSMDVNEAGTIPPTFVDFNGDYTLDASGRGHATLTIPGFDAGVFNFNMYIVSANKFYLLSSDSLGSDNPIFGGPAVVQNQTSFQPSNLQGPAIFSLEGVGTNQNGNPAAQALIGQLTFDGTSAVALRYDENSGGQISLANIVQGTYDVQENGRTTLSIVGTTGATDTWLLYAIDDDQAYMMDATTAAVDVGSMDKQTASQPFSNADVLGTYTLGNDEPVVASTSLASGTISFDGSNGLNGLGDAAGASSTDDAGSLLADQNVTGGYSISLGADDGRGTLLLTSPTSATIALWVTSATQMTGLDVDASIAEPVVLKFQQ